MLTPTVYSTVQPVTLQPIPTNSYNQTIRSNQYQSNQSYQPYQNYSINQNNVIGNFEHTRVICLFIIANIDGNSISDTSRTSNAIYIRATTTTDCV